MESDPIDSFVEVSGVVAEVGVGVCKLVNWGQSEIENKNGSDENAFKFNFALTPTILGIYLAKMLS